MADSPDQSSTGNSLIELSGGIELLSSPINVPPGTCYDMLNYETDQGPGYVRSWGWGRYDGRIQGPTLDDFWVSQFSLASWNGVSAQYSESITLNYASGYTFPMLCIGFIAPTAGTPGYLIMAYPPLLPKAPNSGNNAPFNSAVGVASGMTISSFNAIADVATGLYNDSQYTAFLQKIQQMHSSTVGRVPGWNYSPPDSSFFYKGSAYCTHDCITVAFTTGTQASGPGAVGLLEGHLIRTAATGTPPTIGRVLSTNLSGGDWFVGNAAGTIVLYDGVDPFSLTNGQTLFVWAADGSAAVSPAITLNFDLPTTTAFKTTPSPSQRSLLYTAPEQISGYYTVKSAAPNWSRVPLTRELPYQQTSGSSGVGFGPIGTAPYSVFEYTRQGLSSVINQLTPITTADIIGNSVSVNTPGSWTGLSNIFVDDGLVATTPAHINRGPVYRVVIQGYANSSIIQAIPAGSSIVGIQFRVKWSGSAVNTYKDTLVSLVSGTIGTPSFRQWQANLAQGINVGTALTSYTYGGPSNTWGEQISLAQLQDATFGIVFQPSKVNTTSTTFSVDCIVMQVTYVPVSRTVYLRNNLAASPTDVPVNIVHYTTDGNTSFSANNATGTLTVSFGGTEASGTAAGKSRPIGANEQIWSAPGGSGTLYGYTSSGDFPVTFPGGNLIDAQEAKWEWIRANFYADPNAEMAFGVNGTEYAVMYDGTYTIRIRTGRRPDLDNPRHVAAFSGNVNLGFNSGDVINTATGRPVTVDGLLNSQANNVGEPITCLHAINGQTLMVGTEKTIRGFQGTDPSNYVPIIISPDINCLEYTLATVAGTPVWCSYRGVETLDTTNAYGSFETRPLSSEATPWLGPRLSGDSRFGKTNQRPVYAIGIRSKRQYRVYFADSYAFTLTLKGGDQTPVSSIQRLRRDNGTSQTNSWPLDSAVMRHAYAGVRTDGSEILLGCFENQNFGLIGNTAFFPYVVSINGARTCDNDAAMASYIDLNPLYAGYPTQQLQFQYAGVFLQALPNTTVTLYTAFDYDGPILTGNSPVNRSPGSRTFTVPYPGGDDQRATWITSPISNAFAQVDVAGYGRMIHMRFDTSSVYFPPRFTHLAMVVEKQMVERT